MRITLNRDEMTVLARQDATTQQDGGFQGLMVELQNKLDSTTGEIDLSPKDLDRIPRYAFDYQNGGWQGRITQIFGRVLGPKLGR